jgi:hypothetical protein
MADLINGDWMQWNAESVPDDIGQSLLGMVGYCLMVTVALRL